MSNGKRRTTLSKATSVAEEASCNDQTVNSSSVSRAEQKTHAKAPSLSAPKTTPVKRKGGLNAATLARIKQEQLARAEADASAARQAEEEERIRLEEERQEAERLRLESERRAKVKENEKNRIERQRKAGVYRTKGQRAKFHRAQVQLEAAGVDVTLRHTTQPALSTPSVERLLLPKEKTTALALASAVIEEKTTEDDDSSDDDWECQHNEDDGNDPNPVPAANDERDDRSQASRESVHHRLRRYHKECESRRSTGVLRAPVICVLGHVDAGKTTLLDNLRRTHVQNDEAGGITQQIGATNVPLETLVERTKACQKIITRKDDLLVPGLLIIDTPGHATFDNLRSRGSSLCDLAILVVDIMNGIQPQTLESIELLTKRRTPFIIALNKIDLLYGWKGDKKRNVECVLHEQEQFTKNHFEKRCNEIIVQFAELGLNAALYYENPDPKEFYSIVPTSARSSDGMGSLIALIIERSQTSLAKRLAYSDELQAAVLEVKTISGLGMAVDVAVINGSLSVGDTIVVPGQEGPIVTQVRALLTPEQNRDIRVATQYNNQKKVVGACGIRLLAKELDRAMAGLPVFVAREPDEIPYYVTEMEMLLSTALNALELKDSGVFVQTSTLGSLEAFLKLLKANHIPCAGVNIGPVHRKDITRASIQVDKDARWAIVLAFDVKIERDAQDHAKSLGIKIFQSDGIYTLLDMFASYQQQLLKENQDKHRHLAAFPCKLKILPQFVFNTSDPIVCGVRVEVGSVRIGTPICVPSRDCIDLGRVVSIEMNRKPVDVAVKNMEVAIKIESGTRDGSKMYGRHFDENDLLVSRVSRETIDVLKEHFRSEMQNADWALLVELKKTFSIV